VYAARGVSVLSLPPVRYLGKISHGLYLYHSPIFFIGEVHKVHLPFYLYGIMLIALVFSAATLSYEFIEKPFLKLKDRFGSRPPIELDAGLIPSIVDQNLWAQSRIPMDMRRHGWLRSLFQASQQ
jgi:peptidoglycan/LPS O-acetylase OafA/YrhL